MKSVKPRGRGGGTHNGNTGAGKGPSRTLALPGPLGRFIAPFLTGLLGRLTYGTFSYR